MRVLIIDDDQDSRDELSTWFHLVWESCAVATAPHGQDALQRLDSGLDLILFVPAGGGYELCAMIRRMRYTPIVILTSRQSEIDVVRALEAGADDYIRKPFSSMELQARIRAVLRRAAMRDPGSNDHLYCHVDLTVDFAARRVMRGHEILKLTPIEYGILCHLIRHAPGVLTYELLLEAVWGAQYRSEREYVRVHVRHLRQKLRDNIEQPRFIATEHGLGYRFLGPPLRAASLA